MSYLPIKNYGVIKDGHTVALVGLNGSIDWLCFPKFDAPSVFGRLLDEQKGGYFQIAPSEEGLQAKQIYLPNTNILITCFFSPNCLAELSDFMPVEGDIRRTWNQRVVRRLEMIKGSLPFKMVCQPAFNYARDDYQVEQSENRVVFRSPALALGLSYETPMQIKEKAATSEFTLKAGDCVTFILHRVEEGDGKAEKSLNPREVTQIPTYS